MPQKICLISEAKIQHAKSNEELFCNRQILNILCLKAVGTCLTQHPHLVEKANHEEFQKYNLIKMISLVYIVLRLKHLAEEKNASETKSKIRKKLCKLILNSHQ